MAGTIEWVPKRLNTAPVVFRGMTGREVGMMTALGLAIFSPLGVLAAIVFGKIAIVPTVAFAGAGITLYFGGTIMRRLRRGRPTSLLYRQLQFSLARKVRIQLAGENLITHSTRYSIKRNPSRKPSLRTFRN